MAEKFISYGRQSIEQSDIDAVVEVLQSDFLTQGPQVVAFEKELCELTGAKHCVAVANGTAALHLAVAALGVDPGMEGVTSANTFLASSNAFIYNGLKPVLADIDPQTYCVTVETLESRLSENSGVLIPVHFAGQPCDMRSIAKLAESRNLRIIEDAAHAIGSKYADGGMVGNCAYSDMTIFSFHPVKTVTTGEGGAITTNSDEIYRKLLMLRSHGVTKDPGLLSDNPGPWYYEMQKLGVNYRMTDMQAALGISQLARLDRFVARRRANVDAYNAAFAGLDWLTTPFEQDGVFSAFHLYVALFDFPKIGKSRAEVMRELRTKGIGTQVHYIPVYRQPYYREHYYQPADTFPNMEKYYEKCLSLPLYPAMSDSDVERVISAVMELI